MDRVSYRNEDVRKRAGIERVLASRVYQIESVECIR